MTGSQIIANDLDHTHDSIRFPEALVKLFPATALTENTDSE